MTDSNTAVTFLPDGNICTPKGFRASGIHCGLRRNKTKKDLALIVSDVPAAAAAVYTLNAVKGAPIAVTKAHLADGRAQAGDGPVADRHVVGLGRRDVDGAQLGHAAGSCSRAMISSTTSAGSRPEVSTWRRPTAA